MTGKGSESQSDDGRDAPVPGENSEDWQQAEAGGSGSRMVRIGSKPKLAMAKSRVNLDEKCFDDLPLEIMKIMELLDFDNSGTLHKDEIQANIKMLQDIRTAVHGDSEGVLSKEEFQEAVDLLQRLTVAKKKDQGVMDYLHMPAKIKKVLATWDVDGSGSVSEGELMSAAKAWTSMKKENRNMKKLLLAGLATILVMFVGMFAISWATVELGKDFKPDAGGPNMVTRDGDIVRTASSDFAVTSTGMMVNRNASTAEGRRLQGTCDGDANCVEVGAAAVATRLSRQEAALRSTIPDRFLREMTELMLDGADGGSLKVQVSAAVRTPDPEAKCGSIVRLTTPHGAVTLDDTELFLPDDLVEHALVLGVTLDFSTSARVGYGRRLSGGKAVRAMFNFIEDYEWKCESVPKPPAPPREFRSELGVQFSCESLEVGGFFPCMSEVHPGSPKPGVLVGEDGAQRLEVHETIVSGTSETIHVISNPNHPLVRRVLIFDHAAKRKVSYRLFAGSQHNCVSAPMATDSEDGTWEDHYMAFMGTVHQDGHIYRKYAVMRRNMSAGTLPSGEPAVRKGYEPADRQVVAWYEKHRDEWRPHKVVPPGGKGGMAAITLFKYFVQSKDARRLLADRPEGSDAVRRRLSDAPPLSHAGVERLADLPRDCPSDDGSDDEATLPAFTSAFAENPETVAFYTEKLAELVEDPSQPLTMEGISQHYGPYWVKQVDNYFGAEEQVEQEEQDDASRRLSAPADQELEETEEAEHAGGNATAARRLQSGNAGWEVEIPGSPGVTIGESISVSSGNVCRQVYAHTSHTTAAPKYPFTWTARGGISMCEKMWRAHPKESYQKITQVTGTASISASLSADILWKGCEGCDCVLSCSVSAGASLSVGNFNTNNRRRDSGGDTNRRRRGRVAMKLTPSITGSCVIAWCWASASATGSLSFMFDPVGPCGSSNDWSSWQADWGVSASACIGPICASYSTSGTIGSGWFSSGRRRCARRRR